MMPSRRRPEWLLLSLLGLLVSVVMGYGADPAHFQAMNLTRFPEAIDLPKISLPNPAGETVSLQSFEGQVILLNFWTTW